MDVKSSSQPNYARSAYEGLVDQTALSGDQQAVSYAAAQAATVRGFNHWQVRSCRGFRAAEAHPAIH